MADQKERLEFDFMPSGNRHSAVRQRVSLILYSLSDKDLSVIEATANGLRDAHDITVAEKPISQIDFKGSTILADRAYGKWEFREFIANHDADFCIPPRKDNTDPWFVDWWLYKERHLAILLVL